MKTKTFLGLPLLALLAVACKKERTCTCDWSYVITNTDSTSYIYLNGYTQNQKYTTTYKKISKRNATKICKSWEQGNVLNYVGNSGPATQTQTTSVNCELK